MSFKMTGKEYNKIKEDYRRYLATFRAINKGSLQGASTFNEFYIYRTFTTRYSDPRACAPMGYR